MTTTREVGAFEAKNRFGTLLDWVEQGDEVLITRRGKIVARLIPGSPGIDKERATQASERILSRRPGAVLGGLRPKDLVNEGRQL